MTAVRAWSGHPGQGESGWRPLNADQFQAERDKRYDDLVDAVKSWTLCYPNVPAYFELHNLPPAEVLLAAARDAQLLVVGRHRHGHLMPGALGHTVRRCLAQSRCPVVITSGTREIADADGSTQDSAPAAAVPTVSEGAVR